MEVDRQTERAGRALMPTCTAAAGAANAEGVKHRGVQGLGLTVAHTHGVGVSRGWGLQLRIHTGFGLRREELE